MGYVLGVDLGTTYSAAAIEADGRTDIVQLGSRSSAVPSVVLLRADGEVLTGEAAERRSQSEPERTAREFKRRLGDPTPLILGGTPFGAEAITSQLLKAIVSHVAEQRGGPADLVAITHPASWGPFKLDLLLQAARQADLGNARFLSEPAAAAIHYASQERIETGAVIAVYDFGGGTFDASLVRKTGDGFEVLGQPEGMERLGGIDFDEAVFRHVLAALSDAAAQLDGDDPSVQAALARVREQCREAKEALSADTEAVVRVILPGLQRDIRITRAEFESLISPRIRETVGALERTARSAGLALDQIDRILLVGGSSRIPLVGAVVRELTGRPVSVDTHPKHAVALGAARQARIWADAAPAVPPAPIPEPPAPAPATTAAPLVAPAPAAVTSAPTAAKAVETAKPETAGAAPPRSDRAAGRGSSRLPVILGAAAAAAIVLAGGFLLLSGGDDDDPPAEPDPTERPVTTVTPTNAAAVGTTAPTTAPTAAPTLAPNTARITAIQVTSGRYSVSFEAAGFTPQLPGQHVHFFFDTVPPTQAGIPASGPWFVYGGPSPFTGYTVAEKPAAATQMCILVANADHSVRQGTGNCVYLP